MPSSELPGSNSLTGCPLWGYHVGKNFAWEAVLSVAYVCSMGLSLKNRTNDVEFRHIPARYNDGTTLLSAGGYEMPIAEKPSTGCSQSHNPTQDSSALS
jgi:hypothetical protein